MSGSVYDQLNRVRKPRVHITLDVETGGAQVKKELPFVVGVLGDFSGDPRQELKPLSGRKFVAIDRDNFNTVMARIAPGLNLRVDNTLAGDGSQLDVALAFNSIEDFEPGRVAEQVPALKALLETRRRLHALKHKVDMSTKLETLLEEVLSDQAKLDAVSGALGVERKD